MPAYRPLGQEILAPNEFISRSKDEGAVAKDALAEESFDINPVASTGPVREFKPIDFGKPFNVVLRRIYTGKFPEKRLFSNRKPMLVTSSIKDITTTSAATRALNLLKQGVVPQSSFNWPDAAEEGTNLMYYSPAMASPFVTISLTMIFEDFEQELFDRASKLFASLAGVPIFMPAIGYLLGASTVLKLAGNVGNQIFNGHPALNENLQLDFSFGGGATSAPGFWIFSSGTLEANKYQFDPTRGLIKQSNSSPYDGPDPVIVVSVDGTPVDGVANFTPLLASASLLGRFFNQQDGSEVAMDTVLQAAKLLNDLTYRKKAEEAKSKLDALRRTAPIAPSWKAR